MTMKYYIITGTSRGLGEAIAKELLNKGNSIFCISRIRNEKLIGLAKELKVDLEYISFDLSQVDNIDSLMRKLFMKINRTKVESLTLINNAGVLAPIKPIELCTSEEIITNTHINMTAPMLLSSNFISLAEDIKVDKQIINISSGAGKKPYFGWSNYCSSKAGIDLFTRCIGLEQAKKEYPVRIISFSPGTIDTEMQQEIRMTAKENFQDIERFISFKEEGKLLAPEVVARYVLQIMDNKEIRNGELLDIKQFQ
jgi:benzil reductase ((S)-benzoin forming)